MPSAAVVYERRRPEETTLYQVVADNLATLYGRGGRRGARDRAPAVREKGAGGYLDCGLLCRGFARLRCDGCEETRLVAFSCKGRGFCPSCLGRKMASTAAHLIEDVLPVGMPLRQWVLTVPFAWRKRLGCDGPLLSALTRLFVKTVLAFYRERGSGCPLASLRRRRARQRRAEPGRRAWRARPRAEPVGSASDARTDDVRPVALLPTSR